MTPKKCPNCGQPICEHASICPNCGSFSTSAEVNVPQQPTPTPNGMPTATPPVTQPTPPQAPQPTTTPPMPSDIAPQHKKSNGLMIVVIILVFLLLAVGVAAFALLTSDDDSAPQKLVEKTSEETEQTDGIHDYTEESVVGTRDSQVMESHPLSVTHLYGGEYTTVAPIGKLTYDPANAFDGKLETCWAIDHEKLYDEHSELGRVITVRVHGNYLTGMTIYNGYQKSQDRFINNMSPKGILIGIVDPNNNKLLKKKIYEGTLENILGPQHFEFPEPIKIQGEEISIYIDTWYDCPSPKGDVSLSELQFMGY